MKKRLDELTVTELITLMEGDFKVLADCGKASPQELATTARDILFEYREIVDPAGMKSFLIETEELLKAKIRHQIFAIAYGLLSAGFIDEATKVLEEVGINGSKLSEERLTAVVKSNLARARATVADIEKSRSDEASQSSDIRRRFDEQTVALMSHFKFQIDTSGMRASLYAHLVARFNREVKMMKKAMKRK